MKGLTLMVLTSLTLLSACNRADDTNAPQKEQGAEQPSKVATSKASPFPLMTVHKTESCGCCKAWVKHIEAYGFEVAVKDVDNLNPIKERVGIPAAMGSCHTGEIDGYFIEGHVPAEDVARLLKEKPDAKGLTVPRMPIGSPGMEMGERRDPYDVLLVHKDGSTSVFAHHGDPQATR